jgi:hypothetical protein
MHAVLYAGLVKCYMLRVIRQLWVFSRFISKMQSSDGRVNFLSCSHPERLSIWSALSKPKGIGGSLSVKSEAQPKPLASYNADHPRVLSAVYSHPADSCGI